MNRAAPRCPQTIEHCGRCAWGNRHTLRPRAQARRLLSRTARRQAPTECCAQSTVADGEPEARCAWPCCRWCTAPDSKRRGLLPVARAATSPAKARGPRRSHPWRNASTTAGTSSTNFNRASDECRGSCQPWLQFVRCCTSVLQAASTRRSRCASSSGCTSRR